MISQTVEGLDWKESVATFNDLATTYPTPQDGWTAYVADVGEIYTYSVTELTWLKTGATFFEDATESVAGKVVLAANGETTGGKVVQANDSRLAQVGVNTGNIANNLTAIQSNDTDIAANLAAIQGNDTDIATNASDILANAGAITSNNTDIAGNATDIAANDTDIATLQNFTSAGYDVFILP